MREIDTQEIEKVLERERQPNHPSRQEVVEQNRYSFVIMDQLEVTPVVQQGFDSLGTYIDESW